MRAKNSRSLKPSTPCKKCFGTGTEIVPGKGARACGCKRRRNAKEVNLNSYRAAKRAGELLNYENQRVQQEVDGVKAFFNGYAPDFITGAVSERPAGTTAWRHPAMSTITLMSGKRARSWPSSSSKTEMLMLEPTGWSVDEPAARANHEFAPEDFQFDAYQNAQQK
jgi:hypothetical protein